MGFGGILRQSTAVDVLIGPFVDSTNGDDEETALTISQGDVLLSKNGQPVAQKNDATACAHDADGFYNCELDATDTNTVGQLTLYVHEAGALAVRHDYQVIEEAVYDILYAASATGAVPVASIANNALTAAAINADAFTAAKFAADVTTEFQSGLATAAALDTVDNLLDTEVAAIKTVVDAIQAKTDNLPSDPADASVVAGLIDAVDNFVDTEVAAIKAVTDKLDTAVELDGAVYRFTTNALEQAPTGGGAADGSGFTAIPWNAAWDAEVQSEAADAITAAGLATAAALDTVDNLLDTEVAAIKTVVDAIQAKTDNLPSDPADASVVAGLITAVDDLVDTEVAAIKTVVDAIQAKTDNLPSDPADASVVAGLIDAVDNFVDTEVAAIKTVVDAIQAKTDSLTFTTAGSVDARLKAAGIDDILDEAIGDGTITMRQTLKLMVAVLAGKLSGAATTTVTIRNDADDTDIVVATVDADGNRSAVTLDL